MLPVLKRVESEGRAEDEGEIPRRPLVERSGSTYEKHEQEADVAPHANGRLNKRVSDAGSLMSESLDISLSSMGTRDSGSGSARVSVCVCVYIQQINTIVMYIVTFRKKE